MALGFSDPFSALSGLYSMPMSSASARTPVSPPGGHWLISARPSHHTPDTPATVSEIARVLCDGGTASVSVYYTNILLRAWPALNFAGRWLFKLGIGLKGRGREDIVKQRNAAEIVRRYDGAQNPIGKSYSRQEFVELLETHFHVREIYFHFFPARALGLRIPKALHRVLDRMLPFMIYASVEKKAS